MHHLCVIAQLVICALRASHSLYHACPLVITALLTPGVVYRGTFGQTGVAVKQLQHNQSAAVSDFRREVRVLSMLQQNDYVVSTAHFPELSLHHYC
jgi:hypothetical protein